MLSTNDFLVNLEPGKKNEFQKYLKNNSNLVNYKFWRRITTIIDGKYSDNQVLKKMKRINKEYMASDSKNMVLIDGELNKQFLDCINDKLLDKNKLERILAGCKKSAQRLLDTDVQNFQKICTIQTRDRRLTDTSCFDENKNANTDETNISYILIEKLLTKNFAVLNLFVELATINNVEIGLESQVLTFLEQKKLLIGFFDWAFDERMKKTLGETEMLREDGVDTKLLRELEKKYATSYIIKVMKKSIKKIIKDPKAYIIKSNQENNNKNISNVCKICEEILTTIENKILDIPKILMDLCTMIKEKSINKFGGDGSNSIISLFFLRIVQKGLLFPQNYGMIREEKITSDVRSALSSISKSLKNIVCGVIDEDETRSGVDEMVVTWKLRVRKILQNVCSPLSPMSLKLKSMTLVPQTDLNNLFYGYSFQSLCDTFRIILPRIRNHVEKWENKDKEQVLPVLENINKSLPQKGRSFSGPKKPEFFSPQPERKLTATLSRKLFNKSFERPKLDHLFIDSNLDK